MKRSECFLTVPMSQKEKTLLERLSKRSKVDSSELVRILLFETGILTADNGVRNPN